jgi:hypothetical protein
VPFLIAGDKTDVSEAQKLTPALSTPGRALLRREINKGLADRAAGRVKDLDVDAILAKGKELFQKRSISNVRQFGVDGRKTLVLLLLLFAIPGSDCFAQTPPPPFDEHAFERVPPTVVKRWRPAFR